MTKTCGKKVGEKGSPGFSARGRISLILALFCFSIFIASCSTLQQQMAASPVVKLNYWGFSWSAKPWPERLQPATKELVRYISLQNKLDGFDEVPRKAESSLKIAAVLRELQSSFSPAINKLLDERLIGVFSVNDLGSSGFAEEVFDEQSGKVYALIVLDQNVLLEKKANDWATWKENSVFLPPKESGLSLHMIIEEHQNNTTQNAARYLLLHELGHVLGTVSNAHPPWTKSRQILSDYPFAKFSWTTFNAGKPVSLYEEKFAERSKIQFYAFAKSQLANNQMADVYRNIRHFTNFVSLQATTSVWEDFAESFATYIHFVRGKRPWQVRIEGEKGAVFILPSCWQESRCREKREFMDKWFDKPF